MNPKISIIVPCYNQAQYLDECLQSVLNQTFISWECIIVDDGSPDNTEEVAKKWVEKDFRFKFSYKLPKAELPHVIDFDFNNNDYLPYRINTIIGKNGTGKTQLLTSLPLNIAKKRR